METGFGCHAELFSEVKRGCTQKRRDILFASLVAQYDRKIKKTAMAYPTLDFKVAVASCQVGFYKAFLRYDHTKGVHFMFFATDYMRSECQKEYRNNRTIHVPHNHQVVLESLKRDRVFEKDESELTTEQREQLVELTDVLPVMSTSSINATQEGSEGKTSGCDNIPQSTFNSPHEEMYSIQFHVMVKKYIMKLPANDRKALIHLEGLFGNKPLTMREAGAKIGKSHQGASDARDRAIKALREHLLSEVPDLVESFGLGGC